jgi:arylsulfatase A
LITKLGSGGFSKPRETKPEKDGPRGQLYDLAKDPGEQNNLWLEKPELVQKLTDMMKENINAGRSVR